MAFNAADLARLLVEREVEAGNIGAKRSIDGCHPGTRIWGAADNLFGAVLCLHRADAQAVGVRVRLGGRYVRDGELRQFLGWILDMLDLETGLQHRRKDVVQRRLCGEVILQP